MLVGLREQLETTHAEVSTARHQRDVVENCVATIRIKRDRHHDMSNAQNHAERAYVSSLHRLNFK